MAKGPARKLRRSSVLVDRVATVAETASELIRADPVLIYSIGKVGTTSLSASIEAATGRPVIKAHGLTNEGLRIRLEREKLVTARPRGIWANQWLKHDLRLRPRHRWQLICGVRDPVGLAASAHFYTLRVRRESEGALPEPDEELEPHGAAVASIIERFSRTEDWFRDELEPVTGIDVYATPFPAEIGCARYRQGRFDALLIRQEDLRRVAPAALGEFFGLTGPCPIQDRNTGTDDPLYRRFLGQWRFPEALIEEAYDSRMARHFYTDAELEMMATRWTRQDTDGR